MLPALTANARKSQNGQRYASLFFYMHVFTASTTLSASLNVSIAWGSSDDCSEWPYIASMINHCFECYHSNSMTYAAGWCIACNPWGNCFFLRDCPWSSGKCLLNQSGNNRSSTLLLFMVHCTTAINMLIKCAIKLFFNWFMSAESLSE